MALLKWNEDEEKEEDQFGSPVTKTIQSVQSAWQPTQDDTADTSVDAGNGVEDSTPSNENYLLSEEKAQFDSQVQEQRAAEEAARVQTAEANRRAAAAQEMQAAAQQEQTFTPVKDTGKGAIPGWNVMSPKAQQDTLRQRAVTEQLQKREERTKFMGNIPLVGTAMNWGAGLASVVGNATGNRELQARADNQRKLLTLGMNTSEFNQQDEKTRNRLETLQTGVTGLGALDVFGAASLAKAPIIASVKAAAKKGITTQAGREIIKEGLQQTANQYGRNVVTGAAVSGAIDPAMQAYIKDGQIDWSSVPSSMLQGGLWAAALPEFSGKARLAKKLNGSGTLTPVSAPQVQGEPITPELAGQPPRVADGVAQPIRDGNLSFDTKPNDSQAPIEIPALQPVTPIADRFTPATPNMPPVAENLAPVQPSPVDMPAPEAPMSLDALSERASLDNVTPVVRDMNVPNTPASVADGTVLPTNTIPAIKSEEVRQLQESRAGTSQAEEAQINQQLQEAQANTPRIDDYDTQLGELDARLERGEISNDEHARLEDELFEKANARGEAMAEDGKGNLPDEMGAVTPVKEKKKKPQLTPEQQQRKDFAEVFTRSTDSNSDMDTRLANAVGLSKDAGSDISELLSSGGIKGSQADRITKLFERAEEIAKSNKSTQKQYRKDFVKGGKESINDAPARERNRETEEAAFVRSQLTSELKKLERKGDWGEKLTQGFENVISGKNSNQLIGAPIERGFTAEVIGNAMNTIKNPIKQIRGATMHGMPGKSAVKRLVRDLKTPPKTVTEGYKYLIGNTYRAAMTPAQAMADSRKGAFRTELTRYAYKSKIGETLSSKDAEKVSRMAGNDMEALVNMGAGVDNGTINVLAYRKALRHWKKFVENGSESDYGNFMDTIDRQTSIVDKMAQGFSTQGKNRAQRAGLTLVNALLPYMRNAVNMSTKGVVLDLNPFTLSLIDGIRKDQRGFMGNLALGIKNKTVDYAVLAALGSTLVYNDGSDPDTVDEPRGVSIHLGDDNYFAIRGTPLELPLGALMVAKQIAQDGVSGNFEDPGHYAGMITPSIPYLDYMTSHGNVIDSLEKMGTEEGDNGYAAKNFAVSNAKSLTPFSNNNVEASMSRFGEGGSLTAKSVYASKEVTDANGETKKVADMPQWYLNSLANNNLGEVLPFVPKRSELKDSRDASGRLRTVDNQGLWMNKTVNDKLTKEHNDTITSLVKYGREAGLGKGTAEMFNTYDTGKNNNFKSIQDAITFLDVAEDGEGKKKPDNAKKLENNEKLGQLAAQIRDGFYGETGSELLTLNGQELKSDASVPNKAGSKNSKLPMSMQSIKNAIAQTDLPSDQGDKLYEISGQKSALYDQLKAKTMSYDQYSAAKGELEKTEIGILSGSASYKKMVGLMDTLKGNGFFDEGGIGSTKSGQTYLWNSLNALLGSKGATPAANYPETAKGFTPWGRGGGGGGSGSKNTNKNGKTGTDGIKWTPAGKRQMATVSSGKYTPVQIKVKLGNEVKKNKTQNYSDRSF